ncbi:putative Cystine-binding periplasmic protein [Streptomyces afghaniensis 772] [Streptomyces afghaniensis]
MPDAGLSNITVTEERKEKYDFATYREDNLAFEARKGSGLKVTGPQDVAGKTVAVGSGTDQEKLLVEWSAENKKAGRKPVDIKYYQSDSDTYLALQSRREIDLYLGPNPDRRLPRGHHRQDGGRRHLLGRRRPARGLHPAATRGQRTGRAARRRAEPHHRQRHDLREGAEALGPVRRGRDQVGDQPAGLPKTGS